MRLDHREAWQASIIALGLDFTPHLHLSLSLHRLSPYMVRRVAQLASSGSTVATVGFCGFSQTSSRLSNLALFSSCVGANIVYRQYPDGVNRKTIQISGPNQDFAEVFCL